MKVKANFIKIALIICSATLLSCGGDSGPAETAGGTGQVQQSYEWKLVTTWPKNFPGLGETPEIFADLVEEMSNGRMSIRVYGAGEIVPPLEVF